MLGTKNVAMKHRRRKHRLGLAADGRKQSFLRAEVARRGAATSTRPANMRWSRPTSRWSARSCRASSAAASPWVYEVIYINRSKLLVSSQGIATSAEMAEMAYQVDYYIHVDTREAALDLITHLPFNGHRDRHQGDRRLCRPGDRAGDQPGRPGHQDGKHQRAHQRNARGREGPSRPTSCAPTASC